MSETVDIVIGIDGGSSKIRACAMRLDGSLITLNNGVTCFSYDYGGTNLYAAVTYNGYTEEQANIYVVDAIKMSISSLLFGVIKVLAQKVRVVGICIGTAGIDSVGDFERQHQVFLKAVESFSGIEKDSLITLSDVEIIAGCSCAPAKVCVIAGTGGNCYGVYQISELKYVKAYVGGVDLPLSDWGSAARIGNDACEQALKISCGIGDDYEFAAAVYFYLGIPLIHNSDSWRAIKLVRKQLDKQDLARISIDVVAKLAERGNSTAEMILTDAARDITHSIYAALSKMSVPCGTQTDLLFVGGVVCNNKFINDFVRNALETQNRFVHMELQFNVVHARPEVGAARIALKYNLDSKYKCC